MALVRDTIMDLKEQIGDKHLEQIKLLGEFKEELATADEGNRQALADLRTQQVKLEAFLKNHQEMFLQYDAIVKGQVSRTEELGSDFNDIRLTSVAMERHTRDLNLLEQRLKD